jgi:hypothetical protein
MVSLEFLSGRPTFISRQIFATILEGRFEMEIDHSIRNVFQMPTPMKISGRSSSITAAFVSAIVPQIYPTDDEIKTALDILGMSPDNISCAYCGAETTEWDHLRPLVADQKPTGFISEIRNLVPSCGKCNQSKGNKYWLNWIVSDAKRSPKSRKITDLEQRIERLKEYERWGDVKPIDLTSMIPPDEWEKHWANWRAVLDMMTDAQSHAAVLKRLIEEKMGPLTRH